MTKINEDTAAIDNFGTMTSHFLKNVEKIKKYIAICVKILLNYM